MRLVCTWLLFYLSLGPILYPLSILLCTFWPEPFQLMAFPSLGLCIFLGIRLVKLHRTDSTYQKADWNFSLLELFVIVVAGSLIFSVFAGKMPVEGILLCAFWIVAATGFLLLGLIHSSMRGYRVVYLRIPYALFHALMALGLSALGMLIVTITMLAVFSNPGAITDLLRNLVSRTVSYQPDDILLFIPRFQLFVGLPSGIAGISIFEFFFRLPPAHYTKSAVPNLAARMREIKSKEHQ